MSRNIPVGERPLTEDEIEYLDSRGRRADIVLNERMVREDAFEDAEPEVSWEDEVHELTVAELKQELGSRGLETSGNKDELRARLVEAGPED